MPLATSPPNGCKPRPVRPTDASYTRTRWTPKGMPSGWGPTRRRECSHPYRLISVAVIAMVTIVAFEFMAISTAMPAAAEELGRSGAAGSPSRSCSPASCWASCWPGCGRTGPDHCRASTRASCCSPVARRSAAWPRRSRYSSSAEAVTGLGAGLVVVVLYVVVGRVYAELRPTVFAWVSAAWVLPRWAHRCPAG